MARQSVYARARNLWKLDEAGGSRADSNGGLTLTDNNTVAYRNLGSRSTVAHFVAANSERFEKLTLGTAVPFCTADITLACWIHKSSALATTEVLVSYGMFGTGHNWELRVVGGAALDFSV